MLATLRILGAESPAGKLVRRLAITAGDRINPYAYRQFAASISDRERLLKLDAGGP
jgi:hypothetical protein